MWYINKNSVNFLPVLYYDRIDFVVSTFNLVFKGRTNNINKTVVVENNSFFINYAILNLTESTVEDLANGVINLDVGEYYVDVVVNLSSPVIVKSLIAKVVDQGQIYNIYNSNIIYNVYE